MLSGLSLPSATKQTHRRTQRFCSQAGIHQHGVISNPLCYEIMTPESVGVPANNLVLRKHSGRHALALRYEDLGYSMQPGEVDAVYERFTSLADRKKRNLRSGFDALPSGWNCGGEGIAAEGTTGRWVQRQAGFEPAVVHYSNPNET